MQTPFRTIVRRFSGAFTDDPPAEPSRGAFWVATVFVLIFAALRFFYLLSEPSFWFDEAASWYNVSGTWERLFRQARSSEDCGGIVFSAVLKLWTSVFGYSELSMRTPSALAALAFVALTMRIGVLVWGSKVGLCAGFLAAVDSETLMFARQTRAYGFLLAFTALAFLGLAVYWSKSRSRGLWILGLACPLVVMTHVFGIFVVGGIAVAQCLLWWNSAQPARRLGSLLPATFPMLLAMAIAIAWAFLMQERIGAIMQEFWNKGSWVSAYLKFVDEWAWLATGSLLMLLRPTGRFDPAAGASIAVVAAAVTVGPGIASLATTGAHHFIFNRYLIALIPCVALAGGYAISRLRPPLGTGAVALILLTVLMNPRAKLYRATAPHSQDVRGVSQMLLDRLGDGDEIVVLPWFNGLTFRYYGVDAPTNPTTFEEVLVRLIDSDRRNRLWIVDVQNVVDASLDGADLDGCDRTETGGMQVYGCD